MKNELRVPVEWLGYCENLPSHQRVMVGVWDEYIHKGQDFGCWTNDVRFFFCSEISLILVRIFEVHHFVWLWESHPLLCFHLCFPSCPRWWGNYYACSVQQWKKKDSPGVSQWYNSIQLCHWTLHPVFAWFLLLLSPFRLSARLFIFSSWAWTILKITTKNSYKMTGNPLTLFILILP